MITVRSDILGNLPHKLSAVVFITASAIRKSHKTGSFPEVCLELPWMLIPACNRCRQQEDLKQEVQNSEMRQREAIMRLRLQLLEDFDRRFGDQHTWYKQPQALLESEHEDRLLQHTENLRSASKNDGVGSVHSTGPNTVRWVWGSWQCLFWHIAIS